MTKLETALASQRGQDLIALKGFINAEAYIMDLECPHHYDLNDDFNTCTPECNPKACADCWNEEVKPNV